MRLPNRDNMKNSVISYLFILIITAFAAAPTLSILSDSIESVIFYNLNEEDTNTTNENIKVFKINNSFERIQHVSFFESVNKDLNSFFTILYAQITTECILPPPELV